MSKSKYDDLGLSGYDILELEYSEARLRIADLEHRLIGADGVTALLRKRIAELERKMAIGENWLLHTKKKHNVLQNRYNVLGRDYEKLYADYTHFINRCSCKADSK